MSGTNQPSSAACPGCGSSIDPRTAVDGLCPRCLLDLATDVGSDIPDRIGEYRILRVLGEGGMGVVYLARQEHPIRRLVAVKCIKLGMDTREVLARFESERQALALMDHPGVARVLDAGSTEDGKPYFVMEYVPGLWITHHCDRHRLDVRQRLELFARVCDATQHAHWKTIIHRDLKPSNVLVAGDEADPAPKIIDFGVAKATARSLGGATSVTAAGDLLGTPSYMSPEQLELSRNVDTRTDVYSLGVLLYELLTGVLPFDHHTLREAGYDEIRRAICETDPRPPSTRIRDADTPTDDIVRERSTDAGSLARRLRGDLDCIVMTCLEKDRARRYGSPARLASDVRRHLRSEPIQARPPSTLYRLGKLARRHRTMVAASALMFLGLVLGAIQAFVGMSRAQAEAANAKQVSEFLIDLFEVADPTSSAGFELTAREVLDAGVARIGELESQPEVQARLMQAIGDVYYKLGLYRDARPMLERSLEIYRAHLEPDHPDFLHALTALGQIANVVGDHEVSRELFAEALDRRIRIHGAEHPQVASVRLGLGGAETSLGNFEEARRLFDSALGILEGHLGPEHPTIIDALEHLGAIELRMGRMDEARALYERALAMRESLGTTDENALAQSLNGLAVMHIEAGDYATAVPFLRRALEIDERVLGPDHVSVGHDLDNLALALMKLGRFPEARQHFERAVVIRTATLGPHHPELASTLGSLGALHQRIGENDTALLRFRQALEIFETALGAEHPGTARAVVNVGVAEEADGRLDVAREHYERALAILEKAHGSEHPVVASTLSHLSRVMLRDGRSDEARAVQERALAIRRAAHGDGHPDVADSLSVLAAVLRAEGEIAEAERCLREALELREKLLGGEHHDVASTLDDLGGVLGEQGRCDEARPLVKRALEIRTAVFGEDHVEARSSRIHLRRLEGC